MPENIVYRYSLILSYSSTKQGLSDFRIWVYSSQEYEFSEGQLDSYATDLMIQLDIPPNLRGAVDISSFEGGVPVTQSEMEFSGHRLNTIYGFTHFVRRGQVTNYFNTSSKGRVWRRSSAFRTTLPRKITQRQLERIVLRKFVKPRVVRRVVISKKKWTSILRQARVLKDPKLRRIASGKLRWAGKTQAEINKAMAKVRQAK